MPVVQLVSVWLVMEMQNASSITHEHMADDWNAECQ